MKYCPYCGASLPEDTVSFCPECGKTLPETAPAPNEEKVPKKEKNPQESKKPKKSKPQRQKKESEPPPLDDYDGYYDDRVPIDEGRRREGVDKNIIKKVIALTVGLLVVISACLAILYLV